MSYSDLNEASSSLDFVLSSLHLPEIRAKFLVWIENKYQELQLRDKKYAVWYTEILEFLDYKKKPHPTASKEIEKFFEACNIPWNLKHHGFVPNNIELNFSRQELIDFLEKAFAEKNIYAIETKGVSTRQIRKFLSIEIYDSQDSFQKISNLFLKERISWKYVHNVGWVKMKNVSALDEATTSFIEEFTGQKTETTEEINTIPAELNNEPEKQTEVIAEERHTVTVPQVIEFLESKYREKNIHTSFRRGVSTNEILDFCNPQRQNLKSGGSSHGRLISDLRAQFSDNNIDWECFKGLGWLPRYEVKFVKEEIVNAPAEISIQHEITVQAPNSIPTEPELISEPVVAELEIKPMTTIVSRRSSVSAVSLLYGKTKEEIIQFLESLARLKAENNRPVVIPAAEICEWLGLTITTVASLHSYRETCKSFFLREQIPWTMSAQGFVPTDEEFIASFQPSHSQETSTEKSIDVDSVVEEMEKQIQSQQQNLKGLTQNLNLQDPKIAAILALAQQTTQANIEAIRAIAAI